MYYYLNNFFLFSILGYIFEKTVQIVTHSLQTNDFLHFWWFPIYGIGIITTILIHKYLEKKRLTPWKEKVWLFIICFIILTIIEYIGGILVLNIFHCDKWNYNAFPLHIGKYISIEVSTIWAFISCFYIYFLKKYTDKIIAKIPKFITIILIIIFIIDNILVLNKIL